MISTSKNPTTRKRQRERKLSRFERCFHSEDRVLFVKVMGCAICGWDSGEPIANAHTGSWSGGGRRSGYKTIVNLCRTHHAEYDAGRMRFCVEHGFDPAKRAAAVEKAWQDWTA